MIQLINISKRYNSKKGNNTTALDNINLKLGDKGLTFILGKSGSGKSTLLNILGGLDKQSSGNIIINNKDTNTFKSSDWDMYRNTYVGFVFQEFNLLDSYDVYNNIKLSLELQNKKISDNDIKEVLSKVSLEDISKRKINELSGGQKQRVAIARAIIKKPEILLCDEPTGNLDSTTSKEIFNILKELSKNTLVIVVSHDEESASIYADRIIRISDGKIVSDTLDIDITSNKELVLKKAHLPFMYSFKMGIDSLFKKKIKFIFSLISLTACFAFLGFTLSLYNSNYENDFLREFSKYDSTELHLYKYENIVDYEETAKKQMSSLFSGNNMSSNDLHPTPINIDDDLVKEIENNTNLKWYKDYLIINNGYITLAIDSDDDEPIYYDYSSSIIFGLLDSLDTSNIVGNIDNNSVVISSYIADIIIHNGILAKNSLDDTTDYLYKPNSYEDIINDNVYIKIENFEYINVSGILKIDTKEYDLLKQYSYNQYIDMDSGELYGKIRTLKSDMMNESLLLRVYISIDKLNAYKNIKNNTTSYLVNQTFYYNNESLSEHVISINTGYLLNNSLIYGSTKEMYIDDLNNDEVVINTGFLNLVTDGDYESKLNEYLESVPDGLEETFLKSYISSNNITSKILKSNIYNGNVYINYNYEYYKNFNIKGVIIDSKDVPIVYFSKNNISSLIKNTVTLNSLYQNISDVNTLKNILKYYPLDKSNVLASSKYNNIYTISIGLYGYKLIGKVGTFISSIVALIFLSNLILNSIKLRKKEMGILRALGSKSIDILKIFIYECLSLCILCITISSIIVPIICNKFYLYGKNQGLNYYFAIFKPYIIGYMFLFAFGLVIIISLLGSIKVIKQKPIEVILDK